MFTDYHIHSDTSRDTKVKIDEYCKRAIELGIEEICITNHQELRTLIDGSHLYCLTEETMEKYIKDIKEARKKYPQLTIKFGTEIGYEEDKEKDMEEFIKKYDFDFVIGSVHIVGDVIVADWNRQYKKSREEILKLYDEYFRLLKKLIRLDFIDCIGHIDGIRRRYPEIEFDYYRKHMEEIAKDLKEHKMGFEINTCGWRLDFKEQHPRKEIIKMFYDAGVEIVTVGSDSHEVSHLGYKIKDAIKLLKDIGFKHICTFEKQKPIFHDI